VSAKPVIPRALARQDAEAAIDHYAQAAGSDVALNFVGALETAFRAIATKPGAGSPRFAHELELPGLRTRRVARFPYLIFYIERDDHIDVWRILHDRRDIPAGFAETEGDR